MSVRPDRVDPAPSPDAATLSVVVAEDNFLAREGIVRLLEELGGIRVAAACGDLPGAREAVARVCPDVVLTDIRMPPTGTDEGITLARELRVTHPDMGVVVLSQHAEPLYALALFEPGSQGRAYLLKHRLADRDELGRAVREVAAGGSLVDPVVVDRLLTHLKDRPGSRLASLTARERETLALVAEGRTNVGIAEALEISPRAVERHINSIFAKLELNDPERVSRRVKAALLFLAGGED